MSEAATGPAGTNQAASAAALTGKPAYDRAEFLSSYCVFCQGTERIYQVNIAKGGSRGVATVTQPAQLHCAPSTWHHLAAVYCGSVMPRCWAFHITAMRT